MLDSTPCKFITDLAFRTTTLKSNHILMNEALENITNMLNDTLMTLLKS